MVRALIFACCIILSLFVSAQVSYKNRTEIERRDAEKCGGMDSIFIRKGKWKKVADDDVFADKTYPRSQWKLVHARIDSVSKLFKEAIKDLSGLEPEWYHSMRGRSMIGDNGPVSYSFISLYKSYYCNQNLTKILLGDETGTWAYVFVNHYNWFAKELGDWDIRNDGKLIRLYVLPPKVGAWKGHHLYQPQIFGSTTRAVVLGHDGKLPWKSLTQREYLTGLRFYYSKYKSVDDEIKIIDDYLQNTSAEELSKPAVVWHKNALRFTGKFLDEKEGTRVIAFSTAYFKKELPRHAAQFMILFWKHDMDAPSLSFKEQFEQNFQLEKLKAMIDK